MSFKFEITQVWAGSEKQQSFGILATFNLNLIINNETVIAINDLKLNRSKEGKTYIGSPYREYEGKDATGKPEKKKIHYIRLWPDKHNWSKQEDIVNAVLSKLEQLGNNVDTPKASTTISSKPSPTIKAQPSSNELW